MDNMRLGTDLIRIPSKSGRMPDWNPDEEVTRKDREKVKRFERRQKQLIEFENRPKRQSNLRFG